MFLPMPVEYCTLLQDLSSIRASQDLTRICHKKPGHCGHKRQRKATILHAPRNSQLALCTMPLKPLGLLVVILLAVEVYRSPDQAAV